nr:hypothetical protein [uncultured Treponema sp.]
MEVFASTVVAGEDFLDFLFAFTEPCTLEIFNVHMNYCPAGCISRQRSQE